MKRGRTEGSCSLIVEANCAQCGKRFGYDPMWYRYRRYIRMAHEDRNREHIFCSWSCICAAEREAEVFYGKKPDKYETAYRTKQECDRRCKIRKKEKAQENV